MIQIDIPMPKTCKDCPIFDGEDCCNLIKSAILPQNAEIERHRECPLEENKSVKLLTKEQISKCAEESYQRLDLDKIQKAQKLLNK
jgi:hypothetical protein